MKSLIKLLANKDVKFLYNICIRLSSYLVVVAVYIAILGLFLLFKQNIIAVRYLLFLSVLFIVIGIFLSLLTWKVLLYWKETLIDFKKYQSFFEHSVSHSNKFNKKFNEVSFELITGELSYLRGDFLLALSQYSNINLSNISKKKIEKYLNLRNYIMNFYLLSIFKMRKVLLSLRNNCPRLQIVKVVRLNSLHKPKP